METKIKEIVQCGMNVSVTVTANDLLQFASHLIKETKKELENAITAAKSEDYLTPDEACMKLHINRTTLWRWHKTGYLTHVEAGGKRLYRQSDINAALSRQERRDA